MNGNWCKIPCGSLPAQRGVGGADAYLSALRLECEGPPSARCAVWGVGHGPWSPDNGDSADGMRESDRSLLPVTASWEPWDGAAWQKAFPQDYFGLASLGASILTYPSFRKVIYSPAGWVPVWRISCQSSPVIHSPTKLGLLSATDSIW